MSFFNLAGTVLKSLFRKPMTVRYPFAPREYLPNTRGSIEIKISDCIFCGLCQRKCPTSAIVVSRENKTWEIDRLRCVSCNACVEVCPKKCLAMIEQYSTVRTESSPEVHRSA
jgi:ech hydrogenase subunit F